MSSGGGSVGFTEATVHEQATGRSEFAPGVPSLLRSMNERSVLELVRSRGPLSRAQVARESGLSKPTVSQVLSALLRADLVREMGRSTGGKGPRALLYEVNPGGGWGGGIDGGRHLVRGAG